MLLDAVAGLLRDLLHERPASIVSIRMGLGEDHVKAVPPVRDHESAIGGVIMRAVSIGHFSAHGVLEIVLAPSGIVVVTVEFRLGQVVEALIEKSLLVGASVV